MPRSDFLRFGVIEIGANIAGATVVIGATDRGTTPVEPLRVRAPAKYQITVSKPGYVSFRASVDVPPDAVVQVSPVLSKDRAWYENGWLIAGAGGAAVAVVATVRRSGRDAPTEHPVRIVP